MPKFKQPKIPRCPDLRKPRVSFDKIRREIQEARLGWLQKVWQAAEPLKGKPLAKFIEQAADAAIAAGLYAASYYHDLPWAIVRRFHDFDTSRAGGATGWHVWLRSRGVYPPDFRRYHSPRSVTFWADIFGQKKRA